MKYQLSFPAKRYLCISNNLLCEMIKKKKKNVLQSRGPNRKCVSEDPSKRSILWPNFEVLKIMNKSGQNVGNMMMWLYGHSM